ncbi:MFS transporter [Rickettsiaceae bacterium]|nr:MFS transporter [Rickettsiaceae bacterium]
MESNRFTAALIWFCVTLFYCYQYILRPLPNILMPSIMAKYGIGADDFGSLGVYYIGYAGAHIPIGILLNRFGAKTILPLGIVCTALGLIPLIYSDSWSGVILGRVLTGAGSAVSALGALQIFRILFHATFARMIGIMVSLGLLTVVYTTPPITQIVETIGMKNTANILLYSGIGLAFVTYFLMPKSLEESSHTDIWTDIKAVVCNYRLLSVSILGGLMVGPLEGFADAWGSAFLIGVYSLTKMTADYTIASISLGMCVGCIILPYISDKTRMHFGVTMLSGFVMLICFIHMLTGDATVNSLYCACFIVGVFSAYQIVIIPKIVTFVSEERSGLAGSVANMIIMTFGLLFHKSIGVSLNVLDNGGSTVSGIKTYSSYAYTASVSIIPIAIAIALVGFILMIMVNLAHARIIARKNSAM